MGKRTITFIAPYRTELEIFTYPNTIPLEKGDFVVFKIRFTKPSKIIDIIRINPEALN